MYHKGLHRFAVFTAFSTFLLIIAGGLVTSNSAGLSVPDWPNTYGKFMFSFPLSQMVGGIFYEHGHRMIASTVGFLTVLLAVWLWRREERAWVRNMGYAAVGAVIAQGVLGGITVLFYLPTVISTAHALLAQTFFCITLAIAYVTSREGLATPAARESSPSIGRMSAIAAAMVFVQLLLGAWMRHSDAGLAISDAPLVYGSLLPPVTDADLAAVNALRMHDLLSPVTLGQIWIHYAHRVGAVLVAITMVMMIVRILRQRGDTKQLATPAKWLGALLVAQITLGLTTVWTMKDPVIATAHVATGALILGTVFLTTIRAFRFAPAAQNSTVLVSPRSTPA